MTLPAIDIVFVIDASESMQPCFDALMRHLDSVIRPLQGNSGPIRFGIVTQSAGSARGRAIYEHGFLTGKGPEEIKKLYSRSPQQYANDFFTPDPSQFISALRQTTPRGNEDMLVALDIAADFPFGELSSTKRVIALFSDEPFETGVSEGAVGKKIPDIVEKLNSRRIRLFLAVPEGPLAYDLSQADGSEVEFIEGGNGLGGVNFEQLLGQIGRSISVSSLQSVREPGYRRALFGQDTWGASDIVSGQNRDIVLGVGESATLSTTEPLENVHVKMTWTAAIDLDLHAFYTLENGRRHHVYFADKSGPHTRLDFDAGVGDRGGKNEENLTVESMANITKMVFATKIYGAGDRFSDYDGKIVIKTNDGTTLHVPLSAQKKGRWCAIARIDNSIPHQTVVENINKVFDDEDEFL